MVGNLNLLDLLCKMEAKDLLDTSKIPGFGVWDPEVRDYVWQKRVRAVGL